MATVIRATAMTSGAMTATGLRQPRLMASAPTWKVIAIPMRIAPYLMLEKSATNEPRRKSAGPIHARPLPIKTIISSNQSNQSFVESA